MSLQVLRRRFTVEQYHRMAEAGIFADGDRVELIEGEIIEMTPIGSRHAAWVDRLNDLLTSAIERRAIVRVQSPIWLGSHSEPQSDLAVLRRRADFYLDAHPQPGDVHLVIEVADTSADFDRTVKIPLYGRMGIPEAWLVEIARMSIEIVRTPSPSGYRESRQAGRGDRLTLETLPQLGLSVDDILG